MLEINENIILSMKMATLILAHSFNLSLHLRVLMAKNPQTVKHK